MQAILELIKERISTCAKNGDMFTLPSEVAQYVACHEDIKPTGSILAGDYWRLEEGGNWLEIEYSSKDKCRVFQVNPDRSYISIKGKFHKKCHILIHGMKNIDC